MSNRSEFLEVFAFPSELGWMAIAGRDKTLHRLVFGYQSAAQAIAALGDAAALDAHIRNWYPALVQRLQAFATGAADDFRDIVVELPPTTEFRRRVLEACRGIPYGRVRSYGELAETAGSPGASRAVGNVMAGNRCPLVIPCHRVVAAGGKCGHFSAPGGRDTKMRLLRLEGSLVTNGATSRRKELLVVS